MATKEKEVLCPLSPQVTLFSSQTEFCHSFVFALHHSMVTALA